MVARIHQVLISGTSGQQQQQPQQQFDSGWLAGSPSPGLCIPVPLARVFTVAHQVGWARSWLSWIWTWWNEAGWEPERRKL